MSPTSIRHTVFRDIRLLADYNQPTRHFLPRSGDLVRLRGGSDSWRWHAIVEEVYTDRDSASPDGVTVELLLRPARILDPLHAVWQSEWHRQDETAPIGSDRVLVAEHVVEFAFVCHVSLDGVGWTGYQTDSPFGYRRA